MFKWFYESFNYVELEGINKSINLNTNNSVFESVVRNVSETISFFENETGKGIGKTATIDTNEFFVKKTKNSCLIQIKDITPL